MTSTALAEFVATCRELAKTQDAVLTIRDAMEQLVADRTKLDDEFPLTGTDNDVTLHEDEHISIITCETMPGINQPPHDHLLQVVIGIIDGAEVHRFFHRGPDGIEAAGGRTIAAGDVLSMQPEAIHAIAAQGPETCRAVHVYLGSLSSVDRSLFHPETFVEEPMTLERYAEFGRPAPARV